MVALGSPLLSPPPESAGPPNHGNVTILCHRQDPGVIGVGFDEDKVQQPLPLVQRFLSSQQQLLSILEKEEDKDPSTLVASADVRKPSFRVL